jgi:phenylpropionate dioxygenase-like ring-hydroxylating dioxygenase large terminal subunit
MGVPQENSAGGSMSRQELLTKTGLGTPGGNLLRRYWQPIYVADELQTAPVSLTIMSEDLVLFRDEQGRPGVLARRCPHRNADLSYGRIEGGGLRCPYHGWLFDVNGTCLEQPNIYGGSKNCDLYRQKSYPCDERGGLIWAYMGPGAPPPMPAYPFLVLPKEHRSVDTWRSHCNYLQAVEGNIDPSHTSFLHYVARTDDSELARRAFEADKAPRITVEETSYGLRIYAERLMPGSDAKVLRISNFILPNAASANGSETRLGLGGASMLWHVPITDMEHQRFEVTLHAKHPIPPESGMRQKEFGADGRRKRVLENRFLQNRDELATSFLGMGPAFPVHDLFVTESMGAITDHATEHLVPSDLGIARARRQILDAIADVQAGKEPKGASCKEPTQMRDFLTLTHQLPLSADITRFAAEMVEQNIYGQAR